MLCSYKYGFHGKNFVKSDNENRNNGINFLGERNRHSKFPSFICIMRKCPESKASYSEFFWKII